MLADATQGRARVLIVDDHAVLRAGLRELINHEGDLETCGEAADVAGALSQIEEVRPDLVVVDLSLHEGHGMELIKQVRARFPAVSMLVLTMHDERLYAERALRAGARGYIHKEEPAENVIHAIRRVLAGGVYLSGRSADRVLANLVGPGATGKAGGEAAGPAVNTLSDREMQVLELLGQGRTTRDIARQLRLSPKTVEAHREHLKKKLGLESATELLRYAVTLAIERPPRL
jgi:DNA-binding NarL/FixJ family response regulator